MKTKTFLVLATLLSAFSLQLSAFAAEPTAPQQIAPGVWRIRIGTPETLGVPSAHRTIPAKTDALKNLPAVQNCPLDFAAIQSIITERGTRIEIPNESEIIYGLGLQGDTFQQQGLFRVLMNNAAVVNQLGLGHASFPYYVSAKGYAVAIITRLAATIK